MKKTFATHGSGWRHFIWCDFRNASCGSGLYRHRGLQITTSAFPQSLVSQVPIYGLNRDLRDVAFVLFAFICCLIWYVRSVKLDKEGSQ